MPEEQKRIIIVGAGIAGLSIAWAIKQRASAVEVVVLERSARAGGNIRTELLDGYVCEWGPDGFLDNAPATLALVRDLRLSRACCRATTRRGSDTSSARDICARCPHR